MIINKKFLLVLALASLLIYPWQTKAQSEFIAPATSAIIQGAERIPSVPTTDTVNAAKETRLSFSIFGVSINLPFGMDTIAIAIVKHSLERIVDSTTEWVSNGFNGNPAYVTNPKQYFADIADGTAGEFIYGSDLGFLCSPFQANIRLSLAQQYYQPRQFQCTLTGITGNIEDFYNDFSSGGWDSWFSMTQNPTNNPYGAYVEAKIELDSRIASAVGLKQSEYAVNDGFLSWADCLETNPPAYIDDPGTDGNLSSRRPNPAHVPGVADGACIKKGPVKTPGSVIQGQLENVLGTGVRQLELADEFDELIGALLKQLLEKTVFGAQGLFNNDGSGFKVTSPSVNTPVPFGVPIPNPNNPNNPNPGSPTNPSGEYFFQEFTVLFSYFDAMNATNLSGDLDYLKSKGIDGIRIFPNWWDYQGPRNFVFSDSVLMSSNGNIKNDRVSKLKEILDTASSKGMIVDVTFTRDTVSGSCSQAGKSIMCPPDYKKGVTSAASLIKDYDNIIIDLQNEASGENPITYFDKSNLEDLANSIRGVGNTSPLSVSYGTTRSKGREMIDLGFDILNWHTTQANDSEYLNDISGSGSIPADTYIGEPYHTDWIDVEGATAEDIIKRAVEAKKAGVSAWTLHTSAGFKLSNSSLEGKLGPVEKEVLNNLSSRLASVSWGRSSSGGTTPTPGGTTPNLLSDVQAERSKYGSTISYQEAVDIINAVAWKNRESGWGLSRKDGGSHCSFPSGNIACDILHHKPTNTLVDVLGSGPDPEHPNTAGIAQWGVEGPPLTADRVWVAPVQP